MLIAADGLKSYCLKLQLPAFGFHIYQTLRPISTERATMLATPKMCNSTHASWEDKANCSRSKLAVEGLLLALGRKRRINRHVLRWQRNVLAGAHRISQRLTGIHSRYVHGRHESSMYQPESLRHPSLRAYIYIHTNHAYTCSHLSPTLKAPDSKP